MPTVQADSHRGNVCKALSKEKWMDCHDVADSLGWPVNGASKVLADVYRADYVHRRDATTRSDVDHEYQLKSNVSVA
jgi:hypothetical protein